MSATPPAPAPAARPRPAAAWLAFSAKMTAQVPAIAGRGGPDRHRRPRRGPGRPRLLPAGQRRDRGQRRPPARRPGHGRPCQPGRPRALPRPVGSDGARVRARRPLPLARPRGHQRRLVSRRHRAGGIPHRGPPDHPPPRRPGLAARLHLPDRHPRLHRRRHPARQPGRGRVRPPPSSSPGATRASSSRPRPSPSPRRSPPRSARSKLGQLRAGVARGPRHRR